MKKISVMAVALAAGVFVLSSCNGKSNGAGGDADSAKVDSVKMSSMGSWDYPEGSALQNPDDISCVLYASSYNSSMKKNEDPAETTHIFYKADFVKAGETHHSFLQGRKGQEGRHRAHLVAGRKRYAARYRC